MEEIDDPALAFVGVALPTESDPEIDLFKKQNGITFDIWKDVNHNYAKILPPGGRSFPIDIVIDKKGIIVYLENDYYPGGALKAAKDALK